MVTYQQHSYTQQQQKINKAPYGLRSSQRAWQDHLATLLTTKMEMTRLKSEPNVYRNQDGTAYLMIDVDDPLFLGEQRIIDKIFSELQQHLLLRPTGVLTPGSTASCLGRKITHKGDSVDIALSDDYIHNILEESNMTNCNPAATPGATALKTTNIEDAAPLDQQQHAQYRRLVGKIQWLSYIRPDISFATKELARALQQPTVHDDKRLKHLIRYLKGTETWKHSLRPTIRLNNHNKMPSLHRCQLGIMRNNTQKHSRILNPLPWS